MREFPLPLHVLLGFPVCPIWLAACRICIVRPDKRFTGDDFLHDAEVTRDIARLRRVRRDAKQSQSAKRKQQSDDTSHGPSKTTRTKG